MDINPRIVIQLFRNTNERGGQFEPNAVFTLCGMNDRPLRKILMFMTCQRPCHRRTQDGCLIAKWAV